MRSAVIVFFWMSIGSVLGMDAREVLSRMQRVYATERLEYRCTYTLFRGPESQDVAESYGGYVYREGGYLYQQIAQTELIYGKDFFLKINHDEGAVSVDIAQQSPGVGINTEQALKECSEVLLDDGGAYYEIKLLLKRSSKLPFSVVSMHINKKNYELMQLDLYYTVVADFASGGGNTDLQAPHMRITFSELKTDPDRGHELLEFARYLKRDDQTLIPTGSCAGYEFIDNRIK